MPITKEPLNKSKNFYYKRKIYRLAVIL